MLRLSVPILTLKRCRYQGIKVKNKSDLLSYTYPNILSIHQKKELAYMFSSSLKGTVYDQKLFPILQVGSMVPDVFLYCSITISFSGRDPIFSQHDYASVYKARTMKSQFIQLGVEELSLHIAQSGHWEADPLPHISA